jgi:hypothetical protein
MTRAVVVLLVLLSSRAAVAACAENVPAGATKPSLVEKIEPRAKAGDLVHLEIAVRHLAGETATLPADLAKLAAGEVRVADDGTFGRGEVPKSAPDPGDPKFATTILRVPFVVLSTALQRKTFTIPQVRVIVLRKGGGDLSVCTREHEIAVDQPTANTPDPVPLPNPPSVPQRTRDERAEAMANAALFAVLGSLALAAMYFWWRRRPKEVPPPPPPVPSWKIAIEAINQARRDFMAGTIETKAYYDRVSDAVRVHLGARYGFDGLESTTDEILSRLRRLKAPGFPLGDVEKLLGECDLVKFANLRPEDNEANGSADLAELVVRATTQPIALRPYEPRAREVRDV